jgi:WD40 repeat protein
LLSRIPRRAAVAALAGILLVAAVIVAVLVSPGTRHPLASAGTSSPAAPRAGGGQTRAGSGTEPASPHNTVATRGTSAQGFAVSPGPRLTDPGSVGLSSVSFSPDGKELFTSDGYLWALPGLTYTTMPSSGTSRWAMFSPSGTTLAAVVSGSAGASVWDARTRARAALLPDTDNTFALTAAYSPDGAELAVGADSGKVYVWDVPRHTLITTLPAQGQPAVQSLAFSPDGKTLAIAMADHTYLRELASHNTVATLPGTIESLAFSPDGKTLAIGNELWNTTTHTRIATLSNARCGSVFGLAFSADSSELAIATGQLTCVWDVAARRLTGTVTDPKGAGATAVAFSRDGRLLATGDDNGSIYLWHVK